jgi:hypothetical protein
MNLKVFRNTSFLVLCVTLLVVTRQQKLYAWNCTATSGEGGGDVHIHCNDGCSEASAWCNDYCGEYLGPHLTEEYNMPILCWTDGVDCWESEEVSGVEATCHCSCEIG